jgi:hypothetical protein
LLEKLYKSSRIQCFGFQLSGHNTTVVELGSDRINIQLKSFVDNYEEEFSISLADGSKSIPIKIFVCGKVRTCDFEETDGESSGDENKTAPFVPTFNVT